MSTGDYVTAAEHYGAALAIARDLEDPRSEAAWLGGLGDVAVRLDDVDTAASRYERSHTIAREIGDRKGEAAASSGLARVALLRNDATAVRDALRDVFTIARDIDDTSRIVIGIELLADFVAALGEERDAIALIGWADAARARTGEPRDGYVNGRLAAIIERARSTLNANEVESAASSLRDLTTAAALDRALALLES